MARSTTFLVSTTNSVQCKAISVCREIVAGENDQLASTNWMWQGALTDPQITVAPGGRKLFRKTGAGGYWQPGDVYAYLQAVNVNATFSQEED